MEATEPIKRRSLKDVKWDVGLLTALRVGLGLLFIISSISKLQYPDLFIDAVQKVGILPDSLGSVFGTVLPWTELFIGCSLILGVFTTFAAGITAAMVFSFIIANIYSLFSPSAGEPCQCLGELVRLSHPAALAIDFAMLFVAGLLLYMRDKSETIGVWRLLKSSRLPRAGMYGLGAVVVAVAMTVSFFLIPAPKSELMIDIDDTLGDGRIVVLLFYEGDPEQYLEEIRLIADLREEYGAWGYFTSVSPEEDPEAVQEFDVVTFPNILLVSDKDGGGYVVDGRFDGAEDEEALVAAIDDLLSDRT